MNLQFRIPHLFLLLPLILHLTVKAQMPVHKEKHHQPVFENNELRILNVFANPGDTTAFHLHKNPICYITIQGTEVFLQEPNSNGVSVTLPDNYIDTDTTHYNKPYIHRFANIGADNFHLVAIENLAHSQEYQKVNDIDDNLLINNSFFNVQRLVLNPGESISHLIDKGAVVILKSGEKVNFNQSKLLKKGDWLISNQLNTHKISNQSNANATIIVVNVE